MRIAVSISLVFLLTTTNVTAQEQSTSSFKFQQLAALYSDDSENRVDFFVQDFRTASGVPSFFIEIFASGPDVGEFSCNGSTLFGNVTEDPVDVVASGKHGSAAFGTGGLVDFFGGPCPSNVQVVAECASSADGTQSHDTCTFQQTSFGNRFRSHHSSFSRVASCIVSVQVGGLTLSVDGTDNGALQAGRSQTQGL